MRAPRQDARRRIFIVPTRSLAFIGLARIFGRTARQSATKLLRLVDWHRDDVKSEKLRSKSIPRSALASARVTPFTKGLPGRVLVFDPDRPPQPSAKFPLMPLPFTLYSLIRRLSPDLHVSLILELVCPSIVARSSGAYTAWAAEIPRNCIVLETLRKHEVQYDFLCENPQRS
jgi:hypothetical protein